MRNPAPKNGKQRKALTRIQKAPTKDWNTLDSIADMPPEYAVVMDNFMPYSSNVVLRAGSTSWATGITGRVETLVCYNKATSSKLFAAITDKIYDVTANGAVGAAVVSGKTNGRWQHTNFATPAGQYMYLVNGADDPLLYDGTTWTPINGASTPAITGVTTNKFINVSVHQNKVWFIEKDSLRVWYLPSASIAGAASQLDLSALFPRGGYLMAMTGWTIDSGTGVDDLAVFITSEGEAAVYRGSDPSSSTTWALQGIYALGVPLSRRCFTKFASDVLYISQDGFNLISSALASTRVYLHSSVTDKIQPSIAGAIDAYTTNYGWESVLSFSQNSVIFNIPVTGGSHQYVLNTMTKGWWRCTGWDAACFEVLGNDLYFGTTNGVYKAFTGTSDNGVTITGKCLPAFSDMGNQNLKQFVMARPIISTDSNNLGVLLSLNVDYSTDEPTGNPTFTTGTASTWDGATWDSGTWAGNLSIKKDWQTVGGVGTTASMYLKTGTSNSAIQWSATEFVYKTGSGYF